MKKLNIEITKAQIEGFSVSFNDGKPDISCTIGLYTDSGKKISVYSLGTNQWEEEKKFELPIEMIEPIMKVAFQLEGIVVRHCKKGQKVIKAPSKKVKKDEIPF